MEHYLFFPASMLTPEGVAWLQRLNKARIEREFGNLPHSDAYAVFRVWTNEHGTGVGIDYGASDNPQILESYLVQGLKIALERDSARLDAAIELARHREEQWSQARKSFRKDPEAGP
jgi:hypothetical protein